MAFFRLKFLDKIFKENKIRIRRYAFNQTITI